MVPKAPQIDQDLSQRLGALACHCEIQMEAGLTQERSEAVLQNLVRHVQQITDDEIDLVRSRIQEPLACKLGCDACCYRSIPATIPEVIEAVTQFEQLTQVQKDKVNSATRTYNGPGSPCPFLQEGLCSIYESRPLTCRGMNSFDQKTCEAWKDGQAPASRPIFADQDAVAQASLYGSRCGLVWEGLDHGLIDLGQALQWVCENGWTAAQLADRFLAGSPFPEETRLALLDDNLSAPKFVEDKRPAFQPKGGEQQPTGHPPKSDEASLAEYNRLALEEGLFNDAISSLDLSVATHAIANIVVPRVYRDEEEIKWWREHFVRAMREFRESSIPDLDKFNALSVHGPAGLAYQGMNDLSIMVEHGRICSDLAASAAPDLTEPIQTRKRDGKLRLGYLSANMHANNGCRWALGWLKNHNDNVESFALNVGTVEDKVSKEFRAHAHHYFHLVKSIVANARFIRSLQLDAIIFTDIGLHAFNSPYATMRLAPVQCTAWGHPVTSGFRTIDYYLSSELMEPIDGDAYYSEKLVRLPGSGLSYVPIEDFPRLDRAHFGLPESGPIIVNVQTKPKLLPQFDHLYAEIAERAKAPVVFLEGFHNCDTIVTKERMAKAGVWTHWLPALKRPEFLALLALADVSLDPPLWSGGNTTIEALSAGTPVVTLPGPFMRARHSLAFLRLAKAPGLIAQDETDYIDLACNQGRRDEAMKGLESNALFNDPKPVTALEEFLSGVLEL